MSKTVPCYFCNQEFTIGSFYLHVHGDNHFCDPCCMTAGPCSEYDDDDYDDDYYEDEYDDDRDDTDPRDSSLDSDEGW